tara:strand:+ start:1248 stop:1964 length:717 start_codon:yes stop_codon:yes gene_type:complete
MRYYEFKADGSTLAVRTINRYADEVGKDSMDYEMFKKSAELLDKQMLKSLAQHIEKSDTAPREYVMKTIADHDPETFKKMYGDQEGYLSIMKPQKDLTDDEVNEGASMMPYYKDPKDAEGKTWTFPDAWSKDEPLDTPYMSNASMRMFLDALGYDPNFEDTGPVPAKEFIARSTQWLQKNIDKPSAEIPTTVDQNPGGPRIYSGGREEGHMNQQIKAHNELARKIIAKYPEVTHFGFN